MNDNKRQMKSLLHLNYSIGMCVCAHTQKSWWAISLEVTQVLEWSSSLGKKKKVKLPTSCIKWNNNPELRETLPSLQMVNYLSADIEQYALCSWCMRFPMCVALQSKGVWCYTVILFFFNGGNAHSLHSFKIYNYPQGNPNVSGSPCWGLLRY